MKGKILITGNKGFLGGYLTKTFEDAGYEVVGFDLPEHDLLTDDFSCLDGVDGVVHCAALKGIPACNANPVKAVEVNVLGTTKLLHACKMKGIKKFLYTSTWAVNSHNKKMYDVTKKAAEEIIIHYIKQKNFPAIIIRLATFYGGGMAEEGCISVFSKHIGKGIAVPINGEGFEIRQFTHVKDIANGILVAFEKAEPRTKPYVIAAKEVVSINDLAGKMGAAVHRMMQMEEPENYEVLSSKDMEKLGWRQKIPLENGIEEMLDM